MPSNLASLEPDALEELFRAADRALTAQHGVGTMNSFTISQVLADHQLVLDWDLPAQDPVPTWVPVSPPGSAHARTCLSIRKNSKRASNRSLQCAFELHWRFRCRAFLMSPNGHMYAFSSNKLTLDIQELMNFIKYFY
jgi:hypothetical protein